MVSLCKYCSKLIKHSGREYTIKDNRCTGKTRRTRKASISQFWGTQEAELGKLRHMAEHGKSQRESTRMTSLHITSILIYKWVLLDCYQNGKKKQHFLWLGQGMESRKAKNRVEEQAKKRVRNKLSSLFTIQSSAKTKRIPNEAHEHCNLFSATESEFEPWIYHTFIKRSPQCQRVQTTNKNNFMKLKMFIN